MTLSLTGGETHSLTQSHHPTPHLTCTVSPVSPSLTHRSHPSLTSPTTLKGGTERPATETQKPNPRRRPATHPMDGQQ
jgi:hypothetical protein